MLTGLRGKSLTCIYGPPGTGKTTAVMQTLNQEIKRGTPTGLIGCFSFTRRASTEIRTRLGVDASNFPFCRTLHSMAFLTLGLRQSDIMQRSDWVALSRECGFPLWGLDEFDSEPKRIMSIEAQARCKGVDPMVLWQALPQRSIVSRARLDRYTHCLRRYKRHTKRYDFTDMIQAYVEKGDKADLPVIIVDEAQDLSPPQWQMLNKLCSTAKRIYLAGDDDQSIYQWAGASTDDFVKCQDIGQDRILDISYRVPERVQELALSVISKVQGPRVQKSWRPKQELGSVQVVPDPWNIDMDLNESWLVLGRSNQILKEWCQWAVIQGIPFVCQGYHGRGYDPDQLRCALTWSRLQSGNPVPTEDALHLYDQIKGRALLEWGCRSKLENLPGDKGVDYDTLASKYGLKMPKAFNVESLLPTATMEQLTYLRLARGRRPVTVSTIHSAKGAEADNVILFSDMPLAAIESMRIDPDSEHRCWYVGVTRAAKRLYVVKAFRDCDAYPFEL